MKNPSFETNLSGWSSWQGVLSRVSGGQDGSFAARVALGCTCSGYSIDDNPNSVPTLAQDAVFQATAWVKADTLTGKAVKLYIPGNGGATASANTGRVAVTLTNTWQQVTVTRTVA